MRRGMLFAAGAVLVAAVACSTFDGDPVSSPPDASTPIEPPEAGIDAADGGGEPSFACTTDAVCDDFEGTLDPWDYRFPRDGGFAIVDAPRDGARDPNRGLQATASDTTDAGRIAAILGRPVALVYPGTFALRAWVRLREVTAPAAVYLSFRGTLRDAPDSTVFMHSAMLRERWGVRSYDDTTLVSEASGVIAARAGEWTCVELVTRLADGDGGYVQLFVDGALSANKPGRSIADGALAKIGHLQIETSVFTVDPSAPREVTFDDVAFRAFPNDLVVTDRPRIGCSGSLTR